MRFIDGRSLFSNKIFGTITCTSKNFLILNNYPNNHSFNLIFFLTPQMHCYCTCLYTVNSNQCKFPCGVSKMILKILKLGIHIHVHLVKQQNEHSPFMTTLITSFQFLRLVITVHVISFPSAAVVLWITNVAGSLGLMLNCP